MEVVQSIDLIVINPKVRSGRPLIAGTSITVEDVVIAMVYHQQEPDGIADWYNLSLAQVHAALAYYYSRQTEIDESMRERQTKVESYKEQRLGSRHQPLFR